ncbi:MAG TPA: hypothetical protein VMK31_01035 [Sphingomicrobium sp.]|nr:hypothetical protein [Sphingomicrobium sp.]
MRLIVATFVLALGACGSESQPQQQARPTAPAAAVEIPTPAAVSSAQLMPIPDDPEALKRLEAMGYTIHEEQGHLHAPGVTGCPAMGEGTAM